MTTLEASLKLRDQFTSVLKSVDDSLNKATKTMNDFKQKVSGPAQALSNLGNAAAASISKLNSSIRSGMSAASTVVKSSVERILSIFGNFGNRISQTLHLEGIAAKFSSVFSGVKSKATSFVSGISSAFNSVKSVTSSIVSSIGSAFSGLKSKISSGFSSIVNAVKNGTSKMGSFFKQSGNAFKQFGSDLKNGFSGIKSSTEQATNSVRGFVTALGLVKVASAAINTVKSSIDGAVSRFDTMQKYPKVMQSLGYSVEQSKGSISALSEGIDGLPTKLDEIVATNQRMVSISGNIDNATQATIGLNNAFLASGASVDDTARGTDQYIKMLSTGKVELDGWNTLMETMPVSLTKVANELGFVGSSAMPALYKAMQNGDITFDQFQNKLIELGTGTGILADLAKTNSEGIATSFMNLRNSITKGMTNVLNKANELSVSVTGSSIAQHLDSMKGKINGFFNKITGSTDEAGNRIEGLMDKLPGLVKKAQPYLEVLKNAFAEIKKPIGEAVDAVRKSLSKLTGGFGSEKSVSGFQKFVSVITDGITKLAGFVEKHSDSIAKLISMLPKLAMAFFGFKIGKGVLSPLLKFGSGLLTVTKATGKLTGNLGSAFAGLFKKMQGSKPGSGGSDGQNPLVSPVESMMGTLQSFAKGASKLALVFGVIKLVEEAAQALKDINDKVPSNLASLAPKLLNMAIALTGMGVFVAIAGKLAEKNPVAAIAGLAVIALISGELMLAAEAMKQLNDKVPDDIGNFASKLANMAIAIGGMGILVAVVGGLMATGIGAIIGGAGLVAVGLLCGELMLAAEAMQQLNDKVPDDIGSVKTKINNIAQAIGYFTEANLGSILEIFSNAVGVINTAVVSAGIQKFVDLSAKLVEFEGVTIPKGISKKISEIQTAIKSFEGSKWQDLIDNAIGTIDLFVVDEAFSQLLSIGKSFSKLENIDFDGTTVKTKIAEIKSTMESLDNDSGIFSKLKNLVTNTIDTGSFAMADEAFRQLSSIGKSLVGIGQIKFDVENVKSKVEDINDIVETLGGAGLKELFGKMIKSAELNETKQAITNLKNLAEPIKALETIEVNAGVVTPKIEEIGKVISAIGKAKLGEWVGGMITSATLGEVNSSIQTLATIRDSINNFADNGEVNSAGATGAIAKIKEVATALSDFPESVNVGNISDVFTQIQSSVTTMMATIQTVTTTGMAVFVTTLQTGMANGNTAIATGTMQMPMRVRGIYGQMVSAGSYIMQGLTAGIQAGASSAITAAQTVASQITTAIRTAMDIHSPSRVMMGLGSFISMGLANGILAAQSLVARASNTLANAAMPGNLNTDSTFTNSVFLDDSDIARMKASSSQQVVVDNKQLAPQIVLNYTGTGNNEQDADALFEQFEQKVVEWLDVALD